MSTSKIVERLLTRSDHIRLSQLASDGLADLLADAQVVEPPSIPADVVTMYSQILVADGPQGQLQKFTLCYPEDAEPPRGFISVCSPFGSSLLGLRVGQAAHWLTPGGDARTVWVRSILFQPEATGDYAL